MTDGAAIRRTVEVKLDELVVGLDVQRSLDQRRVDKLAAAFNSDAMGSLTISLRNDGTRAIIDGQHRWAAATQVGYDQAVNAIQYEGLTTAEEANLFLTLNDAKQVQPIDKFRARVLSGELRALTIRETLARHGWTVRISADPWTITAIGAVEKVYDGMGVVQGDDPTLLDNTMTVVTGAWHGNPQSTNASILTSLGKFIGWYGAAVDYDKLINELANLKPRALVADFRSIREISRVDMANAGARVLQGVHNKGRRTAGNKLPEWINR